MKSNISELSYDELSASISWYVYENYYDLNLIPEKQSWRIHFDSQIIVTEINDNGMDWFVNSQYNNPEFFLSFELIGSNMGSVIAQILATGEGFEYDSEAERNPFWDAMESHSIQYKKWFEANRNEFLEIEDELMKNYREHYQGKFDANDSDEFIISL